MTQLHSFYFIYAIIRRKEGMNTARIKRDPKQVALTQAIIDAYNPKSVEDMNDTLKDLFESMLQDEMNHHLGYELNG